MMHSPLLIDVAFIVWCCFYKMSYDARQSVPVDRLIECVAACLRVSQCDAACCSVLQRVAACCSVLQCVAVWISLQTHWCSSHDLLMRFDTSEKRMENIERKYRFPLRERGITHWGAQPLFESTQGYEVRFLSFRCTLFPRKLDPKWLSAWESVSKFGSNPSDWCSYYYSIKNSPIALLESVSFLTKLISKQNRAVFFVWSTISNV